MVVEEKNLIIAIKNYAKVSGISRKKILKDMTENIEDMIDTR